MPFPTIATVLVNKDHDNVVLEQAIALAGPKDRFLDILCLGLDLTPAASFTMDASPGFLELALERAKQDAKDLAGMATSATAKIADRTTILQRFAPLNSPQHLLWPAVQYADLVVMAQPYAEGRDRSSEVLVETVLFGAGTPVLITPPQTTPQARFDNIILAWNGTREALNTVWRALPLMQVAKKTQIVMVDPVANPNEASPGADLLQMLTRHGVKAKVTTLKSQSSSVSQTLLDHAKSDKADLIVMGAYGHSRFREFILGGATRNMLQQADMHVLIAH